jgi:hypothetical protein
MEPTTCLICNESVGGSSGKGPSGAALKSKKLKPGETSSSSSVQLISDAKSKFALTNSQYLILQKVLSLPEGTCKTELINGPYCRECFTNINNVCHIMSALENLQESIREFRKDFGAKVSASFGIDESLADSGSSSTSGRRKRKSTTGKGGGEEWIAVRRMLLDCKFRIRQQYIMYGVMIFRIIRMFYNQSTSCFLGLQSNSFQLTSTPVGNNKAKHLHEIISEMGKPRTNVKADLVLRTTNGNMPMPTGSRTKRPTYKKAQAEVKKTPVKAAEVKTPAAVSKLKPVVVGIGTGDFVCNYQICQRRFMTQSALNFHLQRIHIAKEGKEQLFIKHFKRLVCE